MRLRTEIRETSGGWYAFGSTVDSSHDLLAAHALLQAMDEVGKAANIDYVFPSNALQLVKQRAAEILAGWLGEE